MSYFYLFFSVLVISQAPNWVKLSQSGIMAMTFWRTFLAAMILFLLSVIKKKHLELKNQNKSDLIKIFFNGFILFLHFLLWFAGVKKTSVANSALLFATNPIYTAFIGYFLLKETITLRNVVVFFICLSGCVFTFYPNLKFSPEAFYGDLLVLASAILFSLYIVLTKQSRQKLSNEPLTSFINLFCSFFALLSLMTLSDEPVFSHPPISWLSFSLMAIFSSVLGHSLFTHCLKYFNINIMSTTMLMNPMWASLTAYILYKETLKPNAIVGFVFISIGLFILYLPGIKNFLSRSKKEMVL